MINYPGKVKIIGGTLRGRNVSVPTGDALRPTSSRLRETLFNWLQLEINGATCLDLFAGSGALGIEALSRGAHQVYFVEKSKSVCEHLKKEIVTLKLTDSASVYCGPADSFLSQLKPNSLDLVFLDPPFLHFETLAYPCIEKLVSANLLKKDALIYCEMSKISTIKAMPEFSIFKEKTVSDVRAYLLRYDPDNGNLDK